MSSDISRQRFDPTNDFSSVLMQQGRVQLDADWNEWNEILDRRFRAETIDIIGRGTVPNETPHGFEIGVDANNNLTIGLGRIYVHGLLAENHGEPPLVFDPILAEVRGSDPDEMPPNPNAQHVLYHKQPYFPKVDTNAELPQELQPPDLTAGPYLVYIDVWGREVTYVERPNLVEKAVGVDTTTRLQTAWQVRLLTKDIGQDVTCDTPIQAWDEWIAPSAGRLTTKAVGMATTNDPCLIPPSGGYRGLENRTYRVEIHDGGPIGTATFKWSRDNASVATEITAIGQNLMTLTVDRATWDSVRRFKKADWVEITDDWREFSGLPGEIRQIDIVDDTSRTITLKTPLTPGLFPVDTQNQNITTPERHTRIKRWDQDPSGPGVIDVPASGTPFILEDGVEVTFSTDPDGSAFRFGDYWIFVARTADASVEEFDAAPPRGVHHHYCKLAIIENGQVTDDCRTLWPPSLGEAGCDCSVCVTEESHNTGTLTLQSAVNQVSATGGKICLGPGIYLITSPITIARGNNIEISGHGLPNLVASGLTGEQSIFQLEHCVDINIEDIAFAGPVVGVAISNSWFTRIKRCLFAADAESNPMSLGVGFSGFVWNAKVHDCFFNNVQTGVGPVTGEAAGQVFIAHVSIQNNEMVCTSAGFRFDDPKLPPLFLEFGFADNVVTGPIGFQFGGQGLDIAIERNSFTLTAGEAGAANAAIVCAGSQVRISGNQIFGDPKNPGEHGIVLAGQVMYASEVLGNRVDGLTGHGIAVRQETVLWDTIISQNQLLGLGGAGIVVESTPNWSVFDLNITNNTMRLVGMGASDVFGARFMAAILLLAPMINVDVNENSMQTIGFDPDSTASRFGIYMYAAAGFRAAGNRIFDVGPVTTVGSSAGISVLYAVGRVDIVDNEVRRASVPPFNGDSSSWWAIFIWSVAGNVAIRGNILESFGTQPTVLVVVAISCVFTDNQCFLDNQAGTVLPIPVVRLGLSEWSRAGAIIASNNFVQVPLMGHDPPTMVLIPKDSKKTLTVVGNITSNYIGVGSGGAVLDAPWASLNVQTG
jgi:hypothetical protein